jgi:NDP-sugar pyrophosphorylase family protein
MTTSLEAVTGVVLAGGFGTRLQKVVKDRPKALAEVSGRPFLAYLLEKLQVAGIRKTVLCTGYLAAQIEAAFGERFGEMTLTYSMEYSPLGTAGAIAHALPHITSDIALVANGDCFFEANLNDMLSWHESRRANATILLTNVPDVSRFGRVETDPTGMVGAFKEKGGSGPGWINAGVYLIKRSMIETIPKGREVSIEKEVFPSWVGKGLCAWQGDGDFLDIGTVESYARAGTFVSS